MKKSLFSLVALSLMLQQSGLAQDTPPMEKPKAAFVRILNAVDVNMKDPWKAGLDLAFKDATLAYDIRSGEHAGYRRIEFIGSDSVVVRSTQSGKPVGRVPATFNAGGFYSIILTGSADDSGLTVTPKIVQDFPLLDSQKQSGRARVSLANYSSRIPVEVVIENGPRVKLPAGGTSDLFLSSGSHAYALRFPYKKEFRELKGFYIVAADQDYSVIIVSAAGRPDRPASVFINNTVERSSAMELLAEPKTSETTTE